MKAEKYSISTLVDVGNDDFKNGKKAGIREVLSHLKRMEHYGEYEDDVYQIPDGWQAKLKEWGL